MSAGTYFPGRGTFVEESYLAGQAEGQAEGQALGQAAGQAESILRLLEGRGVAVSVEVAERVRGCGEREVLTRWFDRAITAETAEAIFEADERGSEASGEA
ncbi:hypothetical protein ACIO3O_07755 [Streptomyces sp. NPDC087440]|uniref:hypothetical protein n=1 Tax=Streptomyces sp. NPDC087440 TaxID=3365790 RepID=UPI00382801EB